MRKTSFAKILVDAILALCCAVAAASAVPTAYGTGFILSKLVFMTALCALALPARAATLDAVVGTLLNFAFEGVFVK